MSPQGQRRVNGRPCQLPLPACANFGKLYDFRSFYDPRHCMHSSQQAATTTHSSEITSTVCSKPGPNSANLQPLGDVFFTAQPPGRINLDHNAASCLLEYLVRKSGGCQMSAVAFGQIMGRTYSDICDQCGLMVISILSGVGDAVACRVYAISLRMQHYGSGGRSSSLNAPNAGNPGQRSVHLDGSAIWANLCPRHNCIQLR